MSINLYPLSILSTALDKKSLFPSETRKFLIPAGCGFTWSTSSVATMHYIAEDGSYVLSFDQSLTIAEVVLRWTLKKVIIKCSVAEPMGGGKGPDSPILLSS
jgi:hypothetical protein